MSSTFLVGDDKANAALGVPYGYLVFEGAVPVRVMTKRDGRGELLEAMSAELINGDEASRLEVQMQSLFEDWAGIKAHIAGAYALPDDFVRGYEFQMCMMEEGVCNPVPHGCVVRKTDRGGGEWLFDLTSLVRGFENLWSIRMHPFDKAALLADIARTPIAPDDEAAQKIFDAAPDEVRRLFYRNLELAVAVKDLLGLLPETVGVVTRIVVSSSGAGGSRSFFYRR